MRPAGIRLVELDVVRLVAAGKGSWAGFSEGVWSLQGTSSWGSGHRLLSVPASGERAPPPSPTRVCSRWRTDGDGAVGVRKSGYQGLW